MLYRDYQRGQRFSIGWIVLCPFNGCHDAKVDNIDFVHSILGTAWTFSFSIKSVKKNPCRQSYGNSGAARTQDSTAVTVLYQPSSVDQLKLHQSATGKFTLKNITDCTQWNCHSITDPAIPLTSQYHLSGLTSLRKWAFIPTGWLADQRDMMVRGRVKRPMVCGSIYNEQYMATSA